MLEYFPAVALLGPRQCGKTTLAFGIKVSVASKLTKGFYTAREDIQPTQTFIVSRNDETWKSSESVIHTNVPDLPGQLKKWKSNPTGY